MNPRVYPAIGLLSAATIAFQLALMQILAITQWHHFAFMVISVALLGFGAAGTVLALFRTVLAAREERGVPLLMLLAGAAMAAAVGLAQHPAVRFDAYLLFTGVRPALRLLLTYAVFSVPFLLAGLAIGWTFSRHGRDIGALYCWNLAGSGAGGLVALGLMGALPPAELPAVLAGICVLAGLLALPRKPGIALTVTALFSLLCVAAAIRYPPALVSSEFKSLSRALRLPGAAITRTAAGPCGLVQIVSSPALRHAPGLSLTYPGAVPALRGVFSNGDWVGPLPAASGNGAPRVEDYATSALPYATGPRRTALILDMGAGAPVRQAIDRGVARVTAVAPNPRLPALLEEELAEAGAPLPGPPALTLVRSAPRTWLLRDRATYDLIVLPTIDTFGGTAGLDAIREQFLFTTEAFGDAWRRLSPRGALAVTCWMDYPPRHALRMAATLIEMLAREAGGDPRTRVAAVRSWGTITFLVKKTPYTPAELRAMRDFCRRMNFDPALLPDLRPSERAAFNALGDDRFFAELDGLFSPRRADLYAAYAFRIAPATDDRPYFAQFLRWRSLPSLAAAFGGRTVPFFEIGYLVVFLTLVQTAAAGVALILLPLARRSRPRHGKVRIILYFGGLGLGYLFVEMALIPRFGLYFGHPIPATAAVVGALLFASGLGSFASERIAALRGVRAAVPAGIVLFAALGGVGLTPLLIKTIAWPTAAKVLVALAILTPPAFLMGVPFAAGIRSLAERNEAAIAWAWGINGCFSVIGASLATIIAVEAGFTALMGAAALAYLVPLAAGLEPRGVPARGVPEHGAPEKDA
ncbi:MAG TPA: hypothetical protein PKH03_00625 [Syntrophales bacterium]|nr:hypothetical protein [Syntrophales bacterium]